MTWNPTHVQLTVLRARNLPTKGKGGAKLNDVFVTIQLAKEKFQTSTIKHAVNPEWFEQCDLMIPNMHSEIQIHVMHRGVITDDFIGYGTIPLWECNLYERPKSQWLHLQGKPHKPPDNKIRGDLEVRVSFQVKSTTDESMNAGLKKSKSPSLKALSNIGQRVGDKLKFVRSKSFREPKSQEPMKQTNGTVSRKLNDMEASFCQSPHNNTNEHRHLSPGSQGNQSFSAIDVSHPVYESIDGIEKMSRSMSLQGQHAVVDDVHYNATSPGNRQSMPPSYWATQTLPYSKGKRYGMAVHRSAENVRDVTSPGQPGYLENMFKKEREVYQNMQQMQDRTRMNSESSEDEPRKKTKQRKPAKEYSEPLHQGSESDSERSSDEEITLPEVKKMENVTSKSVEVDNVMMNNLSPVISESPSHKSEESNIEDKTFTETSFPESSADPQYHNLKPENTSKDVQPLSTKSDNLEEEEKELVPPPRNRKKIAPTQNFTFGQSPDKTEVEPKRRPKKERDRLRQLYKQGGRRYTVQGLQYPRRQNSVEEKLVDLRPQYPQEMAIPQDLITVYRNMTKEELIQLVIQHKAQLIRKDQYVKDMEDYMDNLLVRVMESSPRLLQNTSSLPHRHRRY